MLEKLSSFEEKKKNKNLNSFVLLKENNLKQ